MSAGLRALAAVLTSYAFGRMVILGWGRVFPYSRTRRCVSMLADILPLVFAVPAALCAWFEHTRMSDYSAMLADATTAFKAVAICSVVCRYVGGRPPHQLCVTTHISLPRDTGGQVPGLLCDDTTDVSTLLPRHAGGWQ